MSKLIQRQGLRLAMTVRSTERYIPNTLNCNVLETSMRAHSHLFPVDQNELVCRDVDSYFHKLSTCPHSVP